MPRFFADLLPKQQSALNDAARGPLRRCLGGHRLERDASIWSVRTTNPLLREGLLRRSDEYGTQLHITDAGRALVEAGRREHIEPPRKRA